MNSLKNWNTARIWGLTLLAPLLLTAAVQAAELPEAPVSDAWTGLETAGALAVPIPEGAVPSWDGAAPEEDAKNLPQDGKTPGENAKNPSEDGKTPEEGAKNPSEDGKTPEEGAKKPAEPVFPEAEDWQLLLVNPWNPLPENSETLALKSLPNGLRVDRRAYEDLMEMLADCRKAGLRPLVCSAYRTQATQTRLYNNKILRLLAAGCPAEEAAAEAARWVAAPGTSEHQTGLAVDIVAASYQMLDEGQAETAEQKWLMEHCWEYGFILRYPSEKEALTGVGYEPWHYRYVGRPAALDIRDSGLCLEEYLERRAARQAADASVPLPAADASVPLPAADAPAG